ncbi:MAG TPA: sugar ABC transporter substrate-binding protein [Arachnia sp.]|nr:sugar ABC transporter substrate-binding protein [Arachnia sp.]
MKKKALTLAALLLAAAPLAACSNPAPAETPGATSKPSSDAPVDKSEVKLAYVSMNLANPWTVEVKNGFETACKDLGIQCLTIDSQYKVDKQVSDIENLINDGYSGFTFIPIDPNATRDLIETAKSKGMATASIAQPQDNANLIYTLDEYDYGFAIGTQAGEWAKEALDCKVKVAIISQDNVEAVIPRGNGVEESIKKICPDANFVSRQAGDTPEGGMQIIESVLQQHPDLNLVVGTNDSSAIGGYQAMVGGKAVGDDRAVFSGDATAEALALMKQPDSIYRGTVDLFPYKGGYESAEILYDWAVNGVPAEQKTIMFPYVPVPQAAVLDGSYEKSKTE